MELNVQDALKTVHDLKKLVEEKLPAIEKRQVNDEEVRGQFNRQFEDLTKQIEEIRKSQLPQANPLAELEERVGMQRGRLFAGQMKLPYARAMALSPYHPMVRSSDREQLKELQDLNDAVVMGYWMLRKREGNAQATPQELRDQLAATSDFQAYFVAMAKAGYVRANEVIHPGSSGIGANLNFTLLSAQLFDMVRIEGKLQPLFQEIPLPRAKTDFPTLTSDTMGVLGGVAGVAIPQTDYAGTEILSNPPAAALSSPTFGKVSFDVRHILGFILWNDDMFEDSVIPWLPMMRRMIAVSHSRAIETALLNGVRTGVNHIDSDTQAGAVYLAQRAWHGLRKLGNATKLEHAAGGGAKLSTTGLRNNRANMGKWGTNPNELFHLIPITSWYDIMKATEVLTVDVFGTEATVKTGVLAKLDGIDLMNHEALRTNLNASGVYDGVTTTRTIAVTCNKTRFLQGIFGAPVVEETRYPTSLATVVQVDQRRDFKPIEPETAGEFQAGVTPVSVLYNVLP